MLLYLGSSIISSSEERLILLRVSERNDGQMDRRLKRTQKDLPNYELTNRRMTNRLASEQGDHQQEVKKVKT